MEGVYPSRCCNTCILTVPQKSKDKNTSLEEQHRRNEISMRRKQQQVQSPTALSDEGAPKSPASTGAMDDLLQKLRAAKPEARDQRDRRRRARLKDRHQVRVASGQEIPEIGVNVDDGGVSEAGEEGGAEKANLLSPTSETAESETSIGAGLTSPTAPGADVADRAAAMLQGLQGPDSLNKDGSLSVRRRRESADNERERRRRRRQQATSKASDDGGLMSPSIPEEREMDGASDAGGSVAGDRPGTRDGREDERPVTRGSDEMPTTPTTVVVPPSPEQKGREDLPTPPPEAA